METKFWKIIGFWAMGLLLLVATMIIIRWIVVFVTWSSLDSGWAQVIGSIAALAVAIFVMSRQNAHAARLIVDADLLALRRRCAAVSAIVARAERLSKNPYTLAIVPREEIGDMSRHCRKLTSKANSIESMLTKLEAIPAHELGSFEIVDSLTAIHGNLRVFRGILQEWISRPELIGLPKQINRNHSFIANVEQAIEKFETGVRNLK
ncbi:hypothetical protein SOM61_08645 [Massilia sp. CFBP9012]|uniref:hypothetical protein n=1 Tax=Massilia sp. CFBP9012 TaxID=3096531 RepID=UPI002A6B47B4|nr:hypothetical protein [Massilia sp. CFBP9012]MDY0975029.1 hypothetical protein [Massilia sp. CFBP9012]